VVSDELVEVLVLVLLPMEMLLRVENDIQHEVLVGQEAVLMVLLGVEMEELDEMLSQVRLELVELVEDVLLSELQEELGGILNFELEGRVGMAEL